MEPALTHTSKILVPIPPSESQYWICLATKSTTANDQCTFDLLIGMNHLLKEKRLNWEINSSCRNSYAFGPSLHSLILITSRCQGKRGEEECVEVMIGDCTTFVSILYQVEE